jgi:hypothetical protein
MHARNRDLPAAGLNSAADVGNHMAEWTERLRRVCGMMQ